MTIGLHAFQSTPSSIITTSRPPLVSVPSEGSRTSTALGTRRTPDVLSPGAISRCRGIDVSLHASNPSGSNALDAEVIPSSSASSTSTSFLRSVDNFGMRLKPWALRAYEKSLEYYPSTLKKINGSDTTTNNATATATAIAGSNSQNRNRAKSVTKSILYRIQGYSLWMLYIFYRGYRGFFVILPAVFREVYRQLDESDLVMDAYGDDDEKEEDEKEHALTADAGQQVSPQQQQQPPARWRTRITISVLSMVLTSSYVFSGAFRVIGESSVFHLLVILFSL